MNQLAQVVKVSRPGFWPTHLWFFLLPLSGHDVLQSPAFWLGVIYISFPMSLLLFGWNDYGDYDSDSLNPRKDSWLFGARVTEPLRGRLPMIVAIVQLPFIAMFVLIGGAKMLLWFGGLLFVNWTYNTLGFKRLPVVDLLNQLGYLLTFLLASWLCSAPQLNVPAMAFSGLFAMQSHLFGQLMDLEEDRIAGRRSTAVMLGPFPSKLLLVSIMIVETVVALTYFKTAWVGCFIAAGASYFLLDAFYGPARYPVWFSKSFFILWNAVVVITIPIVWRFQLFAI